VTGVVTVVGLGPGGPDLLTAGTLAALAQDRPRFLRTTRHPSVVAVADAIAFDDVYDTAIEIDAVYSTIADAVAAAAQIHSDVLYAVPGSPVVAERTVELLLARDDVDVRLVPALSFLDLAWVRLGIDPVAAGVRVIDGQQFDVEAAGERGPLLVAQCESQTTLSDIKLAVDADPDGAVTVISHLGLDDEAVFDVEWADLDRTFTPDHLTSIYIPSLAAPVSAEAARLLGLVRSLRAGCPWDAEQTHRSLTKYLLEETHEVLDVLDRLPEDDAEVPGDAADLVDALCEELGDLLFQIMFHSVIAAEHGWFEFSDVASGVHDKLYARHPHVFGDVEVESAAEVAANWEAIKVAEKGRESVLDGIPPSLPALARAAKVHQKATSLGLKVAIPAASAADGVGEKLADLVAAAVAAGVDPEAELRRVTQVVEEEIRALEVSGIT
jgi:tetrapyrrole methylase family protein/MazG family protein